MFLLDDVVLDKDVLELRLDRDEQLYFPEKWYDVDTEHRYQKACLSLVETVSNYCDMSKFSGYEFWIHHNTRPQEWHIDKDERALKETGVISCPLCSIVYYPLVEDVTGGRLCLLDEDLGTDVVIVPKQNRLVVLPSGQRHYVEPFEGRRVAFIVNPWDKSKYLYPDYGVQ
tara:strand:- start:1010 stop:1522 length:513 start_codon:yes stop_codon:yes gene_type:complete